jgi:hypothetical protein
VYDASWPERPNVAHDVLEPALVEQIDERDPSVRQNDRPLGKPEAFNVNHRLQWIESPIVQSAQGAALRRL